MTCWRHCAWRTSSIDPSASRSSQSLAKKATSHNDRHESKEQVQLSHVPRPREHRASVATATIPRNSSSRLLRTRTTMMQTKDTVQGRSGAAAAALLRRLVRASGLGPRPRRSADPFTNQNTFQISRFNCRRTDEVTRRHPFALPRRTNRFCLCPESLL